MLWGSTLGFHYILKIYARDPRFLDPGPLIGGYLFIAISGLLFIAIGILASSMTRNQAVAGIVSFTLLLGIIGGLSYVGELSVLNNAGMESIKAAVDSLRITGHVADFTQGIIDTRQVFFYLTGTVLALLFSILGVEAKILSS
jgi:ABC-2 type transport system permease protein